MLVFLFNLMAIRFPQRVERIYSQNLNPFFVRRLSLITGFLPFSVGEIVFLIYVFCGILWFVFAIKNGLSKTFRAWFFKYYSFWVWPIVGFMLLWGFNYHRMPIVPQLGIESQTYSLEELYEVSKHLVEMTNQSRLALELPVNQVYHHQGGKKEIFKQAEKGFLNENIIVLEHWGKKYGKPKPILSSPLLIYTGITGIYFPFTAEANINTSIPEIMMPFTVLHEMAHQRGVATEDEANFLAFYVGINHPDLHFQYSSYFMGMLYATRALHRESAELYEEVLLALSEDVANDLMNYRQFWSQYQGRARKTANRVNNTYLQLNNQSDGVKSYGRVVDWIIAYYQ